MQFGGIKSNINKIFIASLVVLSFVTIALFGMSMGMKTNAQGIMSDCPFMNGTQSVCQMSVAEHITNWQQMFTATPQSNIAFLILTLLIFAASYLFFWQRPVLDPPLLESHWRYYKEKPETKLFNQLLIAFSDGILNPRIYA